ncbi:MAG: hypothetical protein WBM57_02255, partial [Woeseiaceae bacterium]
YADMPGFPRAEQRLLATLIGGHRHAIDTSAFKPLPKAWRSGALRLLIILRLAVLLNRSRKEVTEIPATIDVTEDGLSLHFDAEWLAENPLTIADLEREVDYLRQVGYTLKVR